MRLIDGDALYEKTAEWEAMALHMVENPMNDEDTTEWKRWSTILTERSAFKFDVADAPTVDAVPVVRCRDCKWWRGPIYGNRCSYHSGPNHTEFYDADEFCSRGERKGGDE